MDIVSIDIERAEGKTYCGTLEYCHDRHHATLLWTMEWLDSLEVTVEFFPGSEFESSGLVRRHQKLLIDHLMDTLMQRTGKESMFK